MQAFTVLDGLVAPIDRANVDTDAIIPARHLRSIKRSGFGAFLFEKDRFIGGDESSRQPNPDFVLNAERYAGAQVLLARRNFGCGSSREHAPWALLDYGFRVLIAPSFADIFFNNSFKNGLLPVVLDEAVVDNLFRQVLATPGFRLRVELETQRVVTPDGTRFEFSVDPFRKYCLLNGYDDIGLSLRHADKIRVFEQQHRAAHAWVFAR
jgi:3-isopropylmalate/(R)-2-methylmalate dehydratase small subunit